MHPVGFRAMLLTGFALAVASAAAAQEGPPPAGDRATAANYPKPTEFPKQDRARVAQHLAKAREIAGTDLFQDMAHRCIISPVFGTRVRGIQHNGTITPTKVFDQLYSVGQNAVSAYALKTSAGIILFDALNNSDEAKNLIEPNLRALGLDPKDVKYLVVTHAHGDHYGGAKYFQDTYGSRIISSDIDWTAMEKAASEPGPFAGLQPPKRDMVVKDGEKLILGDTTITFYITPGHTDGLVSAIFPVTDNGVKHMVGLHGGTGGGRNERTLRQSIPAFERWGKLTAAAGVDTLITNHPLHSEGLEREELLRYRLPGQPNPFVLGRDAYQRYVQIQAECARVQLARLGAPE